MRNLFAQLRKLYLIFRSNDRCCWILSAQYQIRLLLLSLLLTSFIAINKSQGADPSGSATTEKGPQEAALAKIEKRFFSAAHSNDSIDHRLERIEGMVYGSPKSGTVQARIKELSALLVEGGSTSSAYTGRLEEIASGKKAQLPVEIKVSELKTLAPIKDLAVPGKTTLLKGQIISYPPEWVGQWGAHMKVLTKSETIATEQIKVGSSGLAIFSFLPKGKVISLLPTNMYFPSRLYNPTQIVYSADDLKRLRSVDRRALLSGSPTLELRDSTGFTIRGDNVNTISLVNSLRLLKPDVLEQDIIVLNQKVPVGGGTPTNKFRETIVRLTRQQREDLLWGQIAHIGYDADGDVQFQYYTEGWLSTNWRTCATEIEKQLNKSVCDLGYSELCRGMSEAPSRK